MKKLLWLALTFAGYVCPAQQLIPYRHNNLWGFANEAGDVVIKPAYSSVDFFETDGYARVHNDTLTTLIDISGKQLLPMKYNSIFPFSDGLAAVCRGGKYNSIQGEIIGGRWGFINEKMEEVIPCKYSRVQSFVNGFAIVQTDGNWGNWGLIDKSEKEILPFQFGSYSFDMRPFPGLIWGPIAGTLQKDISKSGERWQAIDLKGRPMGTPYTAMHGKPSFNEKPTGEDYYFKKFPGQGQEIKLTLPSGKISTIKRNKVSFESLGHNLFSIHRLKDVQQDDDETSTAALVTTSGKVIVNFGKYDSFFAYSDGAIMFLKNGLYGFMDATTGNEIVPARYDYANAFKNGYAKVYYNYRSRKNKIEGFINKSGKEFFTDDPVIHAVTEGGNLMLLDERNYLIHPWIGTNIKIHGQFVEALSANGEIEKLGKATVPVITHVGGWDDYCCSLGDRTFTGIDSASNKIKLVQLKKEDGVLYSNFVGDTLIQITKDGKIGLLSLEGKTVLPLQFDKIELAAPGHSSAKSEIAYAATQNEKIGFYSYEGREIVPNQYINFTSVRGDNQKPLLKVALEKPEYEQQILVLDLKGQKVFSQDCDQMDPLGENSNYQLFGSHESNYGVLKNYSTIVLQPSYSDVSIIIWGKQTFFSTYKPKMGYTLVDSTGRTVVPQGLAIDFSPDENFPTDGPAFFIIYHNKKNGVARSDKGLIIPINYTYIEVMRPEIGASRFFLLQQEKKKGIADTDGKLLLPISNEDIELTSFNSKIFFVFRKKSMYGLAGENGEIILPPNYKSIMLENPEYFYVSDKSDKQFRMGKDLKLVEEKEE